MKSYFKQLSPFMDLGLNQPQNVNLTQITKITAKP